MGPFQPAHTINGCVGPENARQQFLGAQERRSPAFPLTLTTAQSFSLLSSLLVSLASFLIKISLSRIRLHHFPAPAISTFANFDLKTANRGYCHHLHRWLQTHIY